MPRLEQLLQPSGGGGPQVFVCADQGQLHLAQVLSRKERQELNELELVVEVVLKPQNHLRVFGKRHERRIAPGEVMESGLVSVPRDLRVELRANVSQLVERES